jgi:hypothetical protein
MCKTLKRLSGETMLLPVDWLCFSRRLRVLLQPPTDPWWDRRFPEPWRPETDSNDSSKTSLKVACGHTPTHSLYARSPSQALVGLLHECSTSTPFLPSSHPLPSHLNTPRDYRACVHLALHPAFRCALLVVLALLSWFSSRVLVCHHFTRLQLRQPVAIAQLRIHSSGGDSRNCERTSVAGLHRNRNLLHQTPPRAN